MAHSGIWDVEPVLRIVKEGRQVVVPASSRVIGATLDHRAEQLTFEGPRTIDGHDVARCGVKWIGWVNAKGESGSAPLESLEVDGDLIRFRWTISAEVTASPGRISFAVHFMDLDGSGAAVYKWSTTACTDVRVIETVGLGPERATALAAEAETGLLQVEVNEGTLNAEVYSAVRRALYG